MNLKCRNWFAENGFSVDAPDKPNDDGELALILACRQGRYDVLRILLEHGVDLNSVDRYGNNALWAACYGGNEMCLSVLAKNVCNLNYQNPSGNTALAYAASAGKDSMVRLLLELGADPGLQNQDGMTAMDLASSRVSLKLLRAVGTKYSTDDNFLIQ